MHLQLTRKLSQPSKVASILDWKKSCNTVLALNFHRNRVGIAVASHPSLGVPCLELEPLRFEDDSERNRKKNTIAGAIDRECLERFSDIIEEYKVCGVVVNWPLQRDTGRMGAACGRVIFALEQLWERSNETIAADASIADADAATKQVGSSGGGGDSIHEQGGLLSRPFCLWDAGHIDLAEVDAFGRCASYGKENESLALKTPVPGSLPPPLETKPNQLVSTADQYCKKEKNYFASKEQYYEDELTVVLGVWDDFCREHWPDLYSKNETRERVKEANKADGQLPLYGDMVEPPAIETSSGIQEVAKKNKKSLITMR